MHIPLLRMASIVATMVGALFLVRYAPPAWQDGLSVQQLRRWIGDDGLATASSWAQGAPAPVPRPAAAASPAATPRPPSTAAPMPDRDAASVAIPFFQDAPAAPASRTELVDAAVLETNLPAPAAAAALTDVPTIDIAEKVPSATPTRAAAQRAAPPLSPRPLASPLTMARGVQTLLLMGSDKRDDDSTWRIDVIMIAVIDNRAKKVDLVSVPRDLFIEKPPLESPNKINTFDYWGEQVTPGGGPAVMKQIVLDNFGVRIDHYARVRFTGFVQTVDALGGVDIYVPCPLYDMIPEENLYLSLRPGRHTLNGTQALAYVRSRAQGGDLSRVERQQQVLIALRQKFRTRNMVPQIPGLYKTLRSAVDTDVGILDAIHLTRLGYNLNFDDIRVLTLRPPDHMETGWAYGMQVWLPDWERIRGDIQALLDAPSGSAAAPVGATAEQIEIQSRAAQGCQ